MLMITRIISYSKSPAPRPAPTPKPVPEEEDEEPCTQTRCKNPAEAGSKTCTPCKQRQKDYRSTKGIKTSKRRDYQKYRDEGREQKVAEGLCSHRCCKNRPRPGFKTCDACQKRWRDWTAKNKKETNNDRSVRVHGEQSPGGGGHRAKACGGPAFEGGTTDNP